TVDDIRGWLKQASAEGIENIMALRGDPPKGQTAFTAVEGGLRYANELVALIRGEFPEFGLGVGGYPEKHVEAISADEDLANLKRKVDAGADAIYTQLFYDNDDFYAFRDRCRAVGITIPLVAGLLPVLSLAQVKRITDLCGSKLPTGLRAELQKYEDDPAGQAQVGTEHATRQCEGLLKDGVDGLHFYILNRADAASQILDATLGRPSGTAAA
ncbi:MAG: methylenetetrahydrofolate reductase, partial [Planctomycetia bacterium]